MTDEQLAVANAHAEDYCTKALGYDPPAFLARVMRVVDWGWCLSPAGPLTSFFSLSVSLPPRPHLSCPSPLPLYILATSRLAA